MTTDRKPPGTGFWATLVVVAVIGIPVLYMLSMGPCAFLMARGAPLMTPETYSWLFEPVSFVQVRLPDWASQAIDAYEEWWLNLGINGR
jgi:hypothetical protein